MTTTQTTTTTTKKQRQQRERGATAEAIPDEICVQDRSSLAGSRPDSEQSVSLAPVDHTACGVWVLSTQG